MNGLNRLCHPSVRKVWFYDDSMYPFDDPFGFYGRRTYRTSTQYELHNEVKVRLGPSFPGWSIPQTQQAIKVFKLAREMAIAFAATDFDVLCQQLIVDCLADFDAQPMLSAVRKRAYQMRIEARD